LSSVRRHRHNNAHRSVISNNRTTAAKASRYGTTGTARVLAQAAASNVNVTNQQSVRRYRRQWQLKGNKGGNTARNAGQAA
jgi:hypothetical protein